MKPFSKDPKVLEALSHLASPGSPQTLAEVVRKRKVRANPAMTGDGSIPQLRSTLERFQSRPVRESFHRETPLPNRMPCIGTPKVTWYSSDKRDPADPHGAGRQGVWKRFFHRHPRGSRQDGLRLYDLGRLPSTAEHLETEWPDALGFLGYLDRIEYDDAEGNDADMSFQHKSWGLWVVPKANALVALPVKGRISNMFVWFGGHLNVDWRGIDG